MPSVCKYNAEGQKWLLEADIDRERHLGSSRWEARDGCMAFLIFGFMSYHW